MCQTVQSINKHKYEDYGCTFKIRALLRCPARYLPRKRTQRSWTDGIFARAKRKKRKGQRLAE